jgi:hypothetical protein
MPEICQVCSTFAFRSNSYFHFPFFVWLLLPNAGWYFLVCGLWFFLFGCSRLMRDGLLFSFVYCLLFSFVYCLLFILVCGLVTPAPCGMVFFSLWFVFFFVWLLPPHAGWFIVFFCLLFNFYDSGSHKAYCLLPIAHCPLLIANCLLPYCPLPIANCLLPFAHC